MSPAAAPYEGATGTVPERAASGIGRPMGGPLMEEGALPTGCGALAFQLCRAEPASPAALLATLDAAGMAKTPEGAAVEFAGAGMADSADCAVGAWDVGVAGASARGALIGTSTRAWQRGHWVYCPAHEAATGSLALH
jgi:hypothetical protein